MTEELTLLESALFQLKAAAASVNEMQLTITVLSQAIESAQQHLSAAVVNDIDFALNDVAGAVGELSAADAERIAPIVTLLQDDVARLKESTSLPVAAPHGDRSPNVPPRGFAAGAAATSARRAAARGGAFTSATRRSRIRDACAQWSHRRSLVAAISLHHRDPE